MYPKINAYKHICIYTHMEPEFLHGETIDTKSSYREMKTIGEQTKILFFICFIIVCGVVAKKNGEEVNPDGAKHNRRAISSTIQVRFDDSLIF